MTKRDRNWIFGIWVLAIALLLSPCFAKAGIDGPWSEYIQETNQLSTCEKAKASYKIAIALDIKFQAILDNPKIPDEIKTVVLAEQAGIWQLENDLIMWAATNCKTA